MCKSGLVLTYSYLKPYRLKWLLTCLLFIFFANSFAQKINQPVFQNLDPEHFGVKAIRGVLYSAAHEKMWMITNKGLGIYNGFTTKHFSHIDNNENTPLSNKILELFEDKSGILWFGYEDQACLTSFNLKTGQFRHYVYNKDDKNSFPESVVSRFLEASDGKLYVTTWGSGIFVLDKSREKHFTLNEKSFPSREQGLRTLATRAMLELEPGKLLITYFHEQPIGYPGIYDVTENIITPFPIEEYRGSLSEAAFEEIKHILSICHFVYLDKSEKLWVGTYSGLVYIDLKNKICKRVSAKIFEAGQILNLDNTGNFIVDDQERLWTSTANSGIMIVDLKTTKAFYHMQGNSCSNCISDNRIGNFTKDNDGNIWVTNGSRGIGIYSPYKQYMKLKGWDELKVEFCNSSAQSIPLSNFLVRNNKNIYLLSFNGISVYNYNSDTIVEIIHPTKTKNETNILFRLAPNFRLLNGKFYFPATFNINNHFGIPAIYDHKSKKFTFAKNKEHSHGALFPKDTLSQPVYVLSGKNHCIQKYNNAGELDTFHVFDKKHTPYPYHSELLSNGKWLLSAGPYKFVVFDPQTKKTILYGSHKGEYDKLFNDSLIESYYYAGKNTVWISTRNGINSYDVTTGEVINRNKDIGIEQMLVSGMVEDEEGNLWFTSARDFYRYDFKTKTLTCFNKALGVQPYGFDHRGTIPSMVTDGETIFFPTVKGLLYFNITKIKLPERVPELSIDKVLVNDSVLSDEEIGLLLKRNLELAHNKNSLILEVNANQLYTPSPSKFRYKLIGLDDKWIDNETSHKIKLQNLPAGQYTLIIESINSYNVSSKPLRISFEIKNPFWKTWWFILISLGCLIFAVVRIIKSREKTLQKRQAELEKIVDERTLEVVSKAQEIHHQKELIEEKQKEIVDSIKYAQRIQKALLASKTLLDQHLNHYFIFFNPKDLVSGDFYWATFINNKFYFIVADSTGHGVPGAFMSLLNISFLNEAINERKIEKPGEILNYVRQRLIQSLAEDGSSEGGKDGMDCSLLRFDFETKTLEYACAHNPVVVIRNNELIELNNDRMPVGKSPKENIGFNTYEFKFEKGDTLYVLTDGYADQFGGESGKKLKLKNLKNYLLTNSGVEMQQQEQILSELFYKWKGNLEQIDDVTIAGIKL